jgi:hypothetical protein
VQAIITDMDHKERNAALAVWPGIIRRLCLFHVRKAWRNKLSSGVRGGDQRTLAVLKAYLQGLCIKYARGRCARRT